LSERIHRNEPDHPRRAQHQLGRARTALLYRYFQMRHPTCGLEINLRRLKANRNLRVLTQTEVTSVSGKRGDYNVTLKISPRYVNQNCTGCGECAKVVATEISNPYECGLSRTKAAYLPYAMAYPQRYPRSPFFTVV